MPHDMIIDRLRAALRAVGIPATEADFAGIIEKGFLARFPDVERLLDAVDQEQLPDMLDAASLPPASSPPNGGIPADDDPTTILGIATQLQRRTISPVELVEQALERIATHDADLNVFQIVMAESALADARAAETELATGKIRGPLHGVPVAVKDLFDVAGYPTAAGSRIRADVMATTDATVVERLRAAGAIVIGKTRMSEFAYSPGSNNAHYGPTANPYDRQRDSGGSSSGSGVATATGMVFAALGTDTGGSIRIPAAHCGIVGLKPTHGRVSLAGGFTLSWSLDHAGPMTRSVSDAALMLSVLAGPDPRDPRTLRPAPDFTGGGLVAGVRNLRVGLLTADGSGQPMAEAAELAAMQRVADVLAGQGAIVIPLELPELEALRLLNQALLAMEAAALHLPWLRIRLDDYGEFMRHRILAAFIYSPVDVTRVQQARAIFRRRVAARLAEVDLLITPTVPGPVPALGGPTPTSFTGPWNFLGWPALSLPAMLGTDDLPHAAQLVARPWNEPLLLRAAFAAEQALGRWVPSL
ncbi:amidase [Chloroflexus sp.]|uniref:amidase n=1 Tax=Chloroflexus sp. TaxID=1904827 RepID=UPI003C70C2AB